MELTAEEKELNELVDAIYSSGYVRGKRNQTEVDDIWAGLIDLVNGYTNSKLSKIVKEMENQKEEDAPCESDEEMWNDGLDRAMEIIKKEITKTK